MIAQKNVSAVFEASPIVPVMVIKDLAVAIPLAQALLDGGINVFEITLRTEAALDAIEKIAKTFPQAIVGAGTVLSTQQYDDVVARGAQFAISPGFTSNLLKHASGQAAPLIPGVSSASEMMQARELGYTHLKFFPAEASGGAKALKALTAPIQDVKICPTGGISEANMNDYLELASVVCVGGSWIMPEAAIEAKRWAEITDLTKSALEKVAS
ncbi:bifunctional 4-hydroxy-2-oxoglutarate aldolase/2-dehydro-3-deoxy-phosphogluconate aldolase [Reinekea marina]|uniref:2-dehydro-3-deoxy-phosphogluconate aldolase n=1 Tax=Reinekea marina TaxID=1310421 RepID=A0ABV7WQK2_9GAMM|nr:bifunctional 4-hydroxy-2-oxoglutarate aldolase/2-dehydro-3-deoxy-phosphogluconate aldolase [Reinekea marina]MDN3648680.1 bifunctional 4-hydroxy-2-oxoglutarate aldolase/2-dehydro-3-deoxy-phosphogluconate aldolase [Reinekea marina]